MTEMCQQTDDGVSKSDDDFPRNDSGGYGFLGGVDLEQHTFEVEASINVNKKEVMEHNLEVWPEDKEEASLNERDEVPESQRRLSGLEIRNLTFSVLAWACTIASLTLVVGTSNVVLLSIGGDSSLSSVPLAMLFLGASLVSFTVTPWHFQRLGRKAGFLVGVGLGLVGTGLGICAVFFHSPPLFIVATTSFGAAMGIGFYLRFAAVEVVPKHWADKAVTLVVSGGCLAAFAGPESAEGTRGIFGDEYLYMGVFLMTGVFTVVNGILTALIQFPAVDNNKNNCNNSAITRQSSSGTNNSNNSKNNRKELPRSRVISILKSRNFITPMLISACSWIIMAVPMSVLRVAMAHVGFSSRQSLLAIELHFLGMYAPGFFTGRWIARHGPRLVAFAGLSIFLIAIGCLQLAGTASSNNDSPDQQLILWVVGMILIGVGWNCAFSSSTVGSTRSYSSRPDCKSAIQAANDGLTFLLAGAMICSASYIYQDGGQGLPGWRTVNWVVFGFIGLLAFILLFDFWIEPRLSVFNSSSSMDFWSSPSIR